MTIQIKNHRLVGVDNFEFIASPNVSSGVMMPVGIVNHYTAGYEGQGAINTFLNKSSKVSAHLVIDREGKVTQMVPFNKIAWHAGPSSYQTWKNLNNGFIGFEYDNIGYVKKAANGTFLDPYGKKFTPDEGQQLVEEKEPRIGSGTFYWPTYTDVQIEIGYQIAQALVKHYGIQAIVTHEEIDTRGWKTDPGPAFPQARFKALLRNEAATETVPGVVKASVTASSLNVRSGAGTQWEKFAEVKKGTIVTVTAQVGDWSYINFENNRNGWVSSQYLQRV